MVAFSRAFVYLLLGLGMAPFVLVTLSCVAFSFVIFALCLPFTIFPLILSCCVAYIIFMDQSARKSVRIYLKWAYASAMNWFNPNMQNISSLSSIRTFIGSSLLTNIEHDDILSSHRERVSFEKFPFENEDSDGTVDNGGHTSVRRVSAISQLCCLVTMIMHALNLNCLNWIALPCKFH